MYAYKVMYAYKIMYARETITPMGFLNTKPLITPMGFRNRLFKNPYGVFYKPLWGF